MSDTFAAAVAAALLAEVSHGPLLWSAPDGRRCYGRDTEEGCEIEVTGDGGSLVTRVTGVQLASLT